MSGTARERARNRRGRPRGTGLPDRSTLERMADLLVDGAVATKTEAIRQLAGDDPSVIRRLQRKFRDCEAQLIEAARIRAMNRYPGPRPTAGTKLVRFWDDLPIWNQYGITVVSTLVLMWLGLEAIRIA